MGYSVEAIFKAVDRVTAPVNRMQNNISRFTRTVDRKFGNLNKTFSAASEKIKTIGFAAVGTFGALGGAIANVASTGMDFEQTIVNAASKFPGMVQKGTKEFDLLKNAAMNVGETTEFAASEAAQGLNFLAMAGFDAKSAVAALPGVVNLATAAQIDLATATDIASDSLGAFGLMSKDASLLGNNLARVNDRIAATATSSNTSVDMMFEAIKEGAPIATAAGASMETFLAMTGELANAGIKGSRAGTTLKNMFTRLAAPVPKAAKLLSQFGVSTKDSNGNLRDIVDVIGELDSAMSGLGTAQKADAMATIFGMEALAGANVLFDSGKDRINAFREALEKSDGATVRMAANMRDTTLGSWNTLLSAIESVKISLFEYNDGGIKKTIDNMTQWLRVNKELIVQNIGDFLNNITTNFFEILNVIRQISGGLVIFFAMSFAIKALTLTIMAAKGAMSLFGVVMTTFTILSKGVAFGIGLAKTAMTLFNIVLYANPIGAIVGAFVALAAVAATIYLAWNPVKEFFSSLWDTISGVTSGIASAASKFGSFFGFTSSGEDSILPKGGQDGQSAPQVITQGDKIAAETVKTINNNESSDSTITIRNETGGSSSVEGAPLPKGTNIVDAGSF